MLQINGKPKSKATKEKLSIARRGKTNSVESNIKRSLSQKGKFVSNETKIKMSISRTGKQLSEKCKAKMSISKMGVKNPNFGTMWITNGHHSSKISKSSIIPPGWIKGRVI